MLTLLYVHLMFFSIKRDCALDLSGDDMVKITAVGADDLAPAGAPAEDEIEITPEMIRAGAAVLTPKQVAKLMDSWESPMAVAEKVFLAMIRAAK